MAEIKPLDQILQPDELSPAFLHSLEQLHSIASSITLSDAVPEDVHAQFDIARHAFVYAWFYYRFLPVAELYAILAIELGLNLRVKDSPNEKVRRARGLRQLLRVAAAEGWIKDSSFESKFIEWVEVGRDGEDIIEEAREVPPERAPSHVEIILDALPKIRNELAHGQFMLTGGVGTSLQRAAEIINQLFPLSR